MIERRLKIEKIKSRLWMIFKMEKYDYFYLIYNSM
jgi:hypothetical protein